MGSAVTLSRRSLLGLAAVALGGCRHTSTPSAPRVDPDAAALASARVAEATLIARYDNVLRLGSGSSRPPRLAAERDIHAAHLAALGGSAATPSATAASAPATKESLRALLRSSAASLRGAAVAAADGSHAATLASIAASHELMAQPGAPA